MRVSALHIARQDHIHHQVDAAFPVLDVDVFGWLTEYLA
jgi:hypothetical protein